jgi:general stress protein 26
MAVLPRVPLTDEQRAEVRAKVLAYLDAYRQPPLVITTGLDGKPNVRLMGAWHDGFTLYIISRKPTHKLEELQRNPTIMVDFYRYDAEDEGIDQPLRHVVITGTAELLLDAASMKKMPFYDRTVMPRSKPSDPPNRVTLESDDSTIERERFGIVVHPTSIRVEGFVPGPRYPIYLTP